MATVTGIWNHSAGAANPLMNAKAASNAADSDSSSSSTASTISANDFLTLLVTEMKNQDPTANTDPNEYINQLVSVNSLEQLININQTVSTVFGTTATGSNSPATGQKSSASHPTGAAGSISPSNVATTSCTRSSSASALCSAAAFNYNVRAQLASGNLSVPEVKPAAQRVAQALSGQH